jgi:glycine dehydrogenase subunit 2
MVEPTETESKETLDRFIDVMLRAAELAETNPNILKDAPVTMPVSRLDEVKAARELNCSYPGFFSPAKTAEKIRPEQ